MQKLKVFEGFAGIGAVSKAIERLNISHELVGFSEIDENAINSFCAIHHTDKSLNWGDICNINEKELPDIDLFSCGSPCQDISISGRQVGIKWTCKKCGYEFNPLDIHWSERGTCPHCNGTEFIKSRSSLIVEGLRIINYKQPKYVFIENVKNLVRSKFKPNFDKITTELEGYGYNVYWSVLNSKFFGVPQNRERVFVIGIRKDIDKGNFHFPVGTDSGIRLKDIMEDTVPEKYYVDLSFNTDTYKEQPTQSSNGLLFVGGIGDKDWAKDGKKLSRNFPQGNRVYDSQGIACSQTAQGGGLGSYTGLYMEADTNKLIKLQDGSQSNRIYSIEGISPTISAGENGGGKRPGGLFFFNRRVRRLTPLECWLLMSFSSEDFYNVKSVGISDTQLYKQAGNSIVVKVVESIFKELFMYSS